MLEMSHQLDMRAAGLSADQKQKISLGRGLVRSDVAAVLFDEPLTVIDPHLKWQLRRKLKQIHHELKLTLIYVTHDQVEALTFADKVVVMSRGRVMQLGTPDALFEKPAHTFVGHFIGSPGMNFLPAVGGRRHAAGGGPAHGLARPQPARRRFTGGCAGLNTWRCRPASRRRTAVPRGQVQDIGTYQMLTARWAITPSRPARSPSGLARGGRKHLAAGAGLSTPASTKNEGAPPQAQPRSP